MKTKLGILLLLGMAVSSFTMDLSVNKSIHIGDNEKRSGCSSVNGSVIIGNHCRITGSCRTVNGTIDVGRECMMKSLQSVNGSIKIDKETRVHGSISSVNGSITCRHGSKILDDVESVNGGITIHDTQVGHNISTFNGNIKLLNGSIVENDIIVKDNHGQNNREKPLYILIDNNSVVKGDVINRETDIKVILQLQDGGKVEGKVKNVIVERD